MDANDLRELYQATILDHNKSPRNFGVLADANRRAEGNNPVCGDHLVVTAIVDDEDRVVDVRFEGRGCAISTASASLMTEAVKGRTRSEVRELFERFHDLVTESPGDDPESDAELGKLAVFSGVREYPVRVKCASLAWHTLRAALEQSGETAKTE